MRLVMASGNAHKAAEIKEILSAHMIEQRPSWVGEVDENAETLAGNARLKARAICEATGTAAVADDTAIYAGPVPILLHPHGEVTVLETPAQDIVRLQIC